MEMDKTQMPDISLEQKLANTKAHVQTMKDKLKWKSQQIKLAQKDLKKLYNNKTYDKHPLEIQKRIANAHVYECDLRIEEYELIQNLYAKESFIHRLEQQNKQAKAKK